MIRLIVKLFYKFHEFIIILLDRTISLKVSYECREMGINPNIEFPISTYGLTCVKLGDNFNVRRNFKLRAYEEFAEKKFYPDIIIGDNFYAATESCITAIGRIKIGDNVTLASHVTINDHAHGKLDYSDVEVPVMQRELSTKGSIIIEDNVWICEGAIILGGVTIGKNSIIAANAVVTKNIPPYSIAGGIPAKVIKTIPHQ